jgi:Peptidase family M49
MISFRHQTAILLAAAAVMPSLTQLKQMSARFAPVTLKYDTSALSPGDRKALPKLVEAARVLNFVFMDQLWSGNRALYEKLQKDATPLGNARRHYFWLNKGPWSDLDDHQAFIPGVPKRKPQGSGFYPEDLTREEFETWAKTLPPPVRQQAEGFFTLVRRNAQKQLSLVPYNKAYAADLEKAAGLLREAAALTENASLKNFLTLRAAAFLSNDYYASDVAWMDLNAPLDITIGPYETYNDEVFGYKAAFEAYIAIRDDTETDRLKMVASHLQEVENNLPIDPRYRNPKLGASAPIRVVNEVFAAGDGAHGVRTAAFNLPNDERVVHEKGSARIMLKNVQEAKFSSALTPIASRVLPKAAQSSLSFNYFFTHILAHELSHGIGPHQIQVAGRATTPRNELKEIYSAIEEAKADVTGLFMLEYLFDHKLMPGPNYERELYTTFLASSFRSLRFGLSDAHGKGMALQFNYLSDKGAFVANSDGTFAVDFARIKDAVRDLTHDLLTIEAQGDYAAAKKMLDTLGVVRPAMQRAIDSLKDLPTDIDPINESGNE